MVHMKIEVYPSLGRALESLGHDECLYTEYFLVENPLTIKYEGRASGYRPVRLVKRRTLKEGRDLSSGTVYPFEGEPSSPGGVLGIHESRSFRFDYKYFLFRREVLAELAEALASAVNENDKVFLDSLKEAITLGMKEIDRKDKDFICLGFIPERGESLMEGDSEIVERSREPITISMEEESWKDNFLDFGKVREEVEDWFKRLFVQDKDKYYWVEMIGLVNKKLGGGLGRVLAEFWEKDNLLGVHSGNLGKVGVLDKVIRLLRERFGDKYVEEVFPEVLGDIYLYLKVPGTENLELVEMVAVPFKLRDSGTKGSKEVDFLVFSKLKVEDKEVRWHTLSKINYLSSIRVELSNREAYYMRVLNTEEVPLGILDGKGKKTILVKSEIQEIVKVEKYSEHRRRLGNLDKIVYKAKVENPIKSLDIKTENFPRVVVGNYREIGSRRTKEESINIEVFLGENVPEDVPETKGTELRTGPECLENSANMLIKKEAEELVKTLLSLEKEEQDQEKKDALKLAAFLVAKALEILEKEEGVDRECGSQHRSYSYYYNLFLYPKVGYHRPLTEYETMSNVLNKSLFSPRSLAGVEKIVSFIRSGGGGKACFSSGGEKVEIEFEELEKKVNREGEVFLLNLLLTRFAKIFGDYIAQVRKAGGRGPELEEDWLRDLDEFSTFLSGAVISSIKRFPTTVKEINMMMEKIYFYVFQTLTCSFYKYNKNDGTWVETIEKPILNTKELALSILGAYIKLDRIVEYIRVRVPYDRKGEEEPGKEVKVERKVYLDKRYTKELAKLYINSGIDGKVIEIARLLDIFDH